MDTFLILPALLMVMAVSAYLFSTLVFKGHARHKRSQTETLQMQYQNLLMEINQLEKDWPQGAALEPFNAQLNQKRQEAVTLIQELQPQSDPESSYEQLEKTLDQMQMRNTGENNLTMTFVCSNCGGKVQSGDKFCANCGASLQEP